MTFLVDHNLKGFAVLLRNALAAQGWLDLLSIRVVSFDEVGLPEQSADRVVWRFAQANALILVTANRNERGVDSLGQTIREENDARSLPVVTISDPLRLYEHEYRQRCCERLAEIALMPEEYAGTGRIFVP